MNAPDALEARARDALRQVDEELLRAVQALDSELPPAQYHERRQALVEHAVKRKIDVRIELERAARAGRGEAADPARWDQVLAELTRLTDEAMASYASSLDVALRLHRGDPELHAALQELRRKAEGLRLHLRSDAETQVDIARQHEKLGTSPAERVRTTPPPPQSDVHHAAGPHAERDPSAPEPPRELRPDRTPGLMDGPFGWALVLLALGVALFWWARLG